MFVCVLQNDPNWHALDCSPVPCAIDRKKLATMARRAISAGEPKPGVDRPKALNHSVAVNRRRTCAISVECVSQKNAYAEQYKHCQYDLSHHLAPKFAMPDMELLRTSRKIELRMYANMTEPRC
jgi:hypothetical protein